MASSQSLGLESYVAGPPPELVSVRAEPLSWVVAVHNKPMKTTVAGYFRNPTESEGFKAMQLPISDDGDSSGLEVRLICIAPQKEGNATTLEQTGGEAALNKQYLFALYESVGVPGERIKVRYARGSKLISVNMAKGTLTMRRLCVDEWRPPEPDKNKTYDPREPREEAHDPPEPNDKGFWRLRQR